MIDTKLEAPLIDFKYDYYGRKLAAISSDGSVRIMENNSILCSLSGHQGPVLGLSWSHPKFGSVLATGGADHKVILWKESSPNKWQIIYEYLGHDGPITSVSWGPYNLGLVLGVTSMDGCISVLVFVSEDKWQISTFPAHLNGALGLSWNLFKESLLKVEEDLVQFASAGADGLIKVWTLVDEEYIPEEIGKHKAWVRAITWDEEIISGSEDGVLIAWEKTSGGWRKTEIADLKCCIFSLSLNEYGQEFAVSCATGDSRVFRKGKNWNFVYSVDESGNLKESS